MVRSCDASPHFLTTSFFAGRLIPLSHSLAGKHLVSGALDMQLRVWDMSSGACVTTFGGPNVRGGHRDYVLSVAYTPDGEWILSGSKDRSVRFWKMADSTWHVSLKGHQNSVICVAVSNHFKRFATGSGDLKARIWSYSTGAKK